MSDRQFGSLRFICGDNRGRYPFCHSLYIEGARVIIDPACSENKLKDLRDKEGVDMVWLSHWHEDHFTYLGLFDGLPIWMSERDLPPLTDIGVLLDWYGIDVEDQRRFWREAIEKQFRYKPRTASRFLRDNEIIYLEGAAVEVIPTPGHTPGHLAFFFHEEKLLFMGDYDLTSFGPWYGDLYSSIDDTIASIKRLKEIPAKTWIACHDTGLFEVNPGSLWDRYETIIREREEKVYSFLSQKRTFDEITSAWLIYGKPREPREFFEFGERALIKKHLEHLEKDNRIIRSGNSYMRGDINR